MLEKEKGMVGGRCGDHPPTPLKGGDRAVQEGGARSRGKKRKELLERVRAPCEELPGESKSSL